MFSVTLLNSELKDFSTDKGADNEAQHQLQMFWAFPWEETGFQPVKSDWLHALENVTIAIKICDFFLGTE